MFAVRCSRFTVVETVSELNVWCFVQLIATKLHWFGFDCKSCGLMQAIQSVKHVRMSVCVCVCLFFARI